MKCKSAGTESRELIMKNEELKNSFLSVFRNEFNNCVYNSELPSNINRYVIGTSYWKALGVLNALRNANLISDQMNMSLYYDLTERYSEAYGKMREYAHNLIDAQPTIDVYPVKNAHVVWTKSNTSHKTQCCSNCHRTFISRLGETIEFCPHCGAKMNDYKGG